MRCNMYLLMSCNRRKRIWYARATKSVQRGAQRAMVRVKSTKSGSESTINKQTLKDHNVNDIHSRQSRTTDPESVNQVRPHERCLRCGRKLKNLTAKQLGYGSVCYKKIQASSQNRLF